MVGPKYVYFALDQPILFDNETQDLSEDPEKSKTLNEMTEKLNSICNPEKTDKLAKADQKKKMDFWGGKEKVMAEGSLVITPPPGIEAEIVNSNN